MGFRDWLDPDGAWLGVQAPLPLDRPFTPAQARGWGVSDWQLRRLVEEGYVRRVLPGVHVAAQTPDTVLTRARALAMVVHPAAVVTDRTAAWLHGVEILPRSRMPEVPPLQVFHRPGHRLKGVGLASGERLLAPEDVVRLDGIRVTSPLRTALDLGRLLWRFDALAALDGFLRNGLDHDELLAGVDRFAGYRGVVQLRVLAPLADSRAESAAESALRLHWEDAGLPRPVPQLALDGGAFRLDLALPALRYAAEYDGAEFHSSDADRDHDLRRRLTISREHGYRFGIFTADDLYRAGGDATARLLGDVREARSSPRLWPPERWYGRG
jgi:hypothetical protein